MFDEKSILKGTQREEKKVPENCSSNEKVVQVE